MNPIEKAINLLLGAAEDLPNEEAYQDWLKIAQYAKEQHEELLNVIRDFEDKNKKMEREIEDLKEQLDALYWQDQLDALYWDRR